MEDLIYSRIHGAEMFNYAEAVGALCDGNTIRGVRVRDLVGPEEVEVKGRVIVNAGGPCLDQISDRIATRRKSRIRMTKGIHLVYTSLSKSALVFFSRLDGRLFL